MKVAVMAIILFVISSIVSGIISFKEISTSSRKKELFILLIPFILIFIRTWILDPSEEAMFHLEVSLSLLAFPVAFFLSTKQLTKKQLNLLGWIFIVSTVSIVFYGELISTLQMLENLGEGKRWGSIAMMVNDPSFPFYFRTAFEEIVTIHPTYATLFLGISILSLTHFALRDYTSFSKINWLVYTVLFVLIILLQVALVSRTPFAASMVGILVLIFLHLKNKIKVLYAAGALFVVFVMLILLVPNFAARFKEISFKNTKMPTEQNEDSFNLRVGIYTCGLEVIKENWLLGVGPGNIQQHLNQCYDRVSKKVYEGKNFNTHNQFLDYWAGLGIAGPLSLLLIFGYLFYNNFKRQNFLPIAIGIFFMIAFATENFLSRQNGIVAFAYFIGLFFYSNHQPELGQEGINKERK